MKKNLSLILILSFFLLSHNLSYSQDINSDVNFLKANLNLFKTLSIFDDVYNAKEGQEEEGKKKSNEIKESIDVCIKFDKLVKVKYETNKQYKELHQNIQALQTSLKQLEEHKETWALLYYLVKSLLIDLVNKKLN